MSWVAQGPAGPGTDVLRREAKSGQALSSSSFSPGILVGADTSQAMQSSLWPL